MIDDVATRADAIELGRRLRDELPALADDEKALLLSEGILSKGLREWTRAVWSFFSKLGSERNWNIHPRTKPKLGKGKGEYLVDFCLFDEKRGCRIACESDWGPKIDIEWAFDKLRGVKADIKIMIFEATHEDGMPLRFRSIFGRYLNDCHHHVPGREFYVFVQFEGSSGKLFLWEPPNTGPFVIEDHNFEEFE